MHVRKTGVEGGGVVGAEPGAGGLGLLGVEGFAGGGAVPVVEFVGVQRGTGGAEEAGGLGRHGDIAETGELADAAGRGVEEARHGPALAGGVGEGLVKVEEAAALGDGGEAGLDGGADGGRFSESASAWSSG